MDTPAPRCSVVVPVRNRTGARLRNCLRSLGWQAQFEPGELEVVVADFGSDEPHLAQTRKAAGEWGCRVVHVSTERVWNRSRALNVGIRAARGDVVLCTDVDMVFAPDFVATAIEALTARDGRAFVLCQSRDLPEDTDGDAIPAERFDEYAARTVTRPTYGVGGCQAAPRAWFHRVRGYDESFAWWGYEDQDMAGRARRDGLELVWISDRTAMLHQWHPKLNRSHRWQIKLNQWRWRLKRWAVRRNWWGWGEG